jgi:hypothetical protein
MPAVSMKYFKDHVPSSVFDNQTNLASALNRIGKRSILESDEISPLTLRLFKMQHGLTEIENCVLNLQPLAFPMIFNQQGFYNGPQANGELYGTQAPSGSIEYVHSYITRREDWNADPYRTPPINNFRFEPADYNQIRIINDNTKVHTFSLHNGIYDFFVNLDSALDRIRLELNSIYFDGAKVLDNHTQGNKFWSLYLDPNNRIVQSISTAGFTRIVQVLTSTLSISIDHRTSKYRNRLIHDGDLEINIDKLSGRVTLPQDPLAIPLIYSIDLLPYVQSIFADIQILLRDIYSEVINDINTTGRIPVI